MEASLSAVAGQPAVLKDQIIHVSGDVILQKSHRHILPCILRFPPVYAPGRKKIHETWHVRKI